MDGAVQAVYICISTLSVPCPTQAAVAARATQATGTGFCLADANCNVGYAGHGYLGVCVSTRSALAAIAAAPAFCRSAASAAALGGVLSRCAVPNVHRIDRVNTCAITIAASAVSCLAGAAAATLAARCPGPTSAFSIAEAKEAQNSIFSNAIAVAASTSNASGTAIAANSVSADSVSANGRVVYDPAVVYDCLAERVSASTKGICSNAPAAIAAAAFAAIAAQASIAAETNSYPNINQVCKHFAIGNCIFSFETSVACASIAAVTSTTGSSATCGSIIGHLHSDKGQIACCISTTAIAHATGSRAAVTLSSDYAVFAISAIPAFFLYALLENIPALITRQTVFACIDPIATIAVAAGASAANSQISGYAAVRQSEFSFRIDGSAFGLASLARSANGLYALASLATCSAVATIATGRQDAGAAIATVASVAAPTAISAVAISSVACSTSGNVIGNIKIAQLQVTGFVDTRAQRISARAVACISSASQTTVAASAAIATLAGNNNCKIGISAPASIATVTAGAARAVAAPAKAAFCDVV